MKPADACGVTVTEVAAEVAEQPAAFVTVTLYWPLADTVMLGVVAPVLQRKEAPPEAVRVTEPPWQKVVLPLAEMLAVGAALIVTWAVAEEAAQPLPAAMLLVTV